MSALKPSGAVSGASAASTRVVSLAVAAAAALAGALALSMGFSAVPARAAFPGGNGRIVFSSDRPSLDGSTDFELYSLQPDGTGLMRLTYNSYLPSGAGEHGEADEGCAGGKGGQGGGAESGAADGASGGEAGASEGGTASGGGTEEAGGGGEAEPQPIDDIQPAVSPDGRQIAFASNRLSAGAEAYSEIYVMGVDGRNVHEVTSAASVGSGPKAAYEPAWSPDGRQIVFRRGEGAKADLWIVDLATGKVTKLRTAYEKGPAGYDAQPAWSPDGSRIAFVKGFGRAADIWVYDLYGPHQGESVPLIHAINVAETSPSWSPDGRWIAYSRGDQRAGAGIWVARADGSDQHPVAQPSPNAQGEVYSNLAPSFSPDGGMIVFESTRDGALGAPDVSEGEGECGGGEEGEEVPEGAVELFEMSADGSHVSRLTTATSAAAPQDLSPEWQPLPLPSAPPAPQVPSQQQLQPPTVEVPVVSKGSKTCVSVRSFTIAIHLTKADRRHARWIHARVNGKRVKVRRHGNRIEVRVDAHRAVKGRLTVKVYVMLRHGNHLWGKHTFRACAGGRSDGLRAFRLQRHRAHDRRVPY